MGPLFAVVFLVGMLVHCYCFNPVENKGFTECGHNVVKIDDRCYSFNTERKVRWKYARTVCQGSHGDLAQPRGQRENEGIKKYLKHIDRQSYEGRGAKIALETGWIGLHQETSFFTAAEEDTNSFTFVDNTVPSYTDWAPGEPTGETSGQFRCYSGKFQWFDERWTRKCAFICQLKECAENCRRTPNTNSPPRPAHENQHVAAAWTTTSSNIDSNNSPSWVTQRMAVATSLAPSADTTVYKDLSDNNANGIETTPLPGTGSTEVKNLTERSKDTKSSGSSTLCMSTTTSFILMFLSIMGVITPRLRQ